MKIVKSLQASVFLIVGSLSMLLDKLGASLLGILLAGKGVKVKIPRRGVIRAGKGTVRAGQDF